MIGPVEKHSLLLKLIAIAILNMLRGDQEYYPEVRSRDINSKSPACEVYTTTEHFTSRKESWKEHL